MGLVAALRSVVPVGSSPAPELTHPQRWLTSTRSARRRGRCRYATATWPDVDADGDEHPEANGNTDQHAHRGRNGGNRGTSGE